MNAAMNTVLYAGLGTTALGLIISFVGTGEKGFLSPQLRLVGPSLLCAGLLCCLIRVLLCLCLCHCDKCCCKSCKEGPSKVDLSKAEANISPESHALTMLLAQPPQRHRPPVTMTPAIPSSSSAPPTRTKTKKQHELLLSPAQLPE